MDSKKLTEDNSITSELLTFRDEWKKELSRHRQEEGEPDTECRAQQSKILNVEAKSPPEPKSHPRQSLTGTAYDEAPFPFQFTDSLLRSWQDTPPSKSKSKKRKAERSRFEPDFLSSGSGSSPKQIKEQRVSLLDIFIDDLNELDDVPFFDISLPREIALKIFSFLGLDELCSCSQVSRAWASIANDNLLWEKVYYRIRRTFTVHTSISGSDDWKQAVRDCYVRTKTLLLNWKDHKCHTTYYHHARGGILTSAHCLDNIVVAGYTNGQVKSWSIIDQQDTLTYEPSNKSLVLIHEEEEHCLASSENSVTCVKLGPNNKLIAGYKHGQVQLWDQSNPDSMMVCDFPGYCVQDITIQPSLAYIHLNSLSNGSCLIKVLSLADTPADIIDSVAIRAAEETWTLPTCLMVSLPIQCTDTTSLLYLTRDSLNIHNSTRESYLPTRYSSSQVEEFYATHFTCLEASERYINLGFTSHLGLQAEYKVRLYDPGSLKHCMDLRGHTSQVTCLDSSYPNGYLIATGCHDRRVRLYDTRLPTAAIHTYMGHPVAVQCIQSDDWKVISGDLEGYICVWDQRMGNKYWESQSRHPVKYLKFTTNHLISANIPKQAADEEQFDSDRMTHIRYRGRLQVSDFSLNHSTSGIPSICSSSYDVPEASNYNLSLITPYDSI